MSQTPRSLPSCPRCRGFLRAAPDELGRREQDGIECINCGYQGPTRVGVEADRVGDRADHRGPNGAVE